MGINFGIDMRSPVEVEHDCEILRVEHRSLIKAKTKLSRDVEALEEVKLRLFRQIHGDYNWLQKFLAKIIGVAYE